jgi:predicted transcriptional regulator
MWQSVHMKKVIRTVEMSAELDAAVERMAKDMARTPSEIVSAAVEQLLADNDDLVIEIARWAEYERTGEAMEEGEVSDRLRSLKQRHQQTPAT